MTTPNAQPTFDDLGLQNDTDAAKIDYKNLPKQRGEWAAPPQPGRYLIGIPGVEKLKAKAPAKPGDPPTPVHYKEFLEGTKKRLRVSFREDASLLNYGLVGGPVAAVPTPLQTQVANNERLVGKSQAVTSDFANLLVALDSIPPVEEQPGNATDLKYLLLAAHAGKRFEGVTDLSAGCNSDSNAFVWDPKEEKNVDSGRKGCGRKYGTTYYKDKKKGTERLKLPEATETYTEVEGGVEVEKTRALPGVHATRFICTCGASLNCFVNIVAFHPATQQG